MTPRPWKTVIPRALAIVVVWLLIVEAKSKIELFGWQPLSWPLEVTFMKESLGHQAFFALFIVPIFLAILLATMRHAEQETDD